MKYVHIISVHDPLVWYSGMEGYMVPLEREEQQFYYVREPDGYRNIIFKEDAEVVDV